MAVLSLSLSAAKRSLADDHLETGIAIITDLIFVAVSLITTLVILFASLGLTIQFDVLCGMSDEK